MAAKRHAGDRGATGAAARPAKAAKRPSGSKDAPEAAGNAAQSAKPRKAAREAADKPAKPTVEQADGEKQTAAGLRGHRKRRRRPVAVDVSAEELARREHQRKRRVTATQTQG